MSLRDFKVFVAAEVLMSALSEWTKLGAFRAIRRGVLDRPKATIALRKRDIGAYAAFCGTAPYIFAALLIWSTDRANLLPPDPLQRAYAEIREWENETAELRGEARVQCEETSSLNASAGRRCFAATSRMLERIQNDSSTMHREIRVFESIKSASVNSILAAFVILLNALVFSRIWLRVHPIHIDRRPEDIGKVWRAYLLVMSTTMFIPNCIGALIFLAIDIMTRIEPWTAGSLSGSVFFAGVLPGAVCGVLGCYRLNEVLLHSSTWRIGHTWWIMLLSNIVTIILLSVIIVPVLVVIFMPLFM
ncbi:MAG TPA: hypothetical protein VMS43_03135 [Allosphingosinicella sp.]|nr:hypothetical protein [Allosphingosinicella sp.]